MDLTDSMRRVQFEDTLGVTEFDAVMNAAFLRRVGVPEQVAGFCRPCLHSGMILGGAHVIDGHLGIEVLEIGPPADDATGREEQTP